MRWVVLAGLAGAIGVVVGVIGAPPSRVPAKLVARFAEELTPPEEFAKQREPRIFSTPGFRPKGAGRPTKRERRLLDGFDAE